MGSSLAQVSTSTQPQGKGGYQLPRPQQSDLGSAINNAAQQGIQSDFSVMHGGPNVGYRGNENMFIPAVQPVGQFQPAQGKGGSVTFPGQGGQPRMGQPNMYPNTVGQWDNASIQPQQPRNRGGKGKG